MIKKLHDHAKSVMEEALERWLCALRGQPYPTKVVLTRIILVRERDHRNPSFAPMMRRHP
jgi:hypothetical protein